MKFLIAIMILLISSSAYADVWIVTEKGNNAVISISNEPDCVVDDNTMKEKRIKDKKLKDFPIVYPPHCYDLKGSKLEANMARVSAYEQEKLENFEYEQEEYEIKKYTKNKNIDEMIANGFVFKYSHKLT